MSRKSQIKAIIDANIKRNGRQEITGPVLNAILNAMLDAGVIDITQDGQILPKDEDGNVEISSISMDGAVRYDVAQLLTEGQKEIARNNIGAPSNAAIVAENERAELAETELGNSVLAETERATQAESELSSRIDTIVQGRNVRDIVANYDELLAYDTSTLGDNDIIMVLLDATKSGHTTYYRWHADTQSWEFIGGLAFTYTKTEIDEKFRALHIIIPDIPEAAVEHPEEYQELLAQVDSLVRSAGADASFRMPIDTIGNVDVTFVKYNPAHIYLGIFADDRSVLYTINRTTSQPRSYSVEIVTKEFVTRAEFDAYSEGVAQELNGLSLKVGELSQLQTTDKTSIVNAINEVAQGGGETSSADLILDYTLPEDLPTTSAILLPEEYKGKYTKALIMLDASALAAAPYFNSNRIGITGSNGNTFGGNTAPMLNNSQKYFWLYYEIYPSFVRYYGGSTPQIDGYANTLMGGQAIALSYFPFDGIFCGICSAVGVLYAGTRIKIYGLKG